jgi:uncharacterized protein YlaN (UPF0358 family)
MRLPLAMFQGNLKRKIEFACSVGLIDERSHSTSESVPGLLID